MAVVQWFAASSSIILCLVLVGNLFVIVTILRERKLSNFKNLLILTLSFSDCFVGAFVIPSIITFPLVDVEWGVVFCVLCHHTAYFATAASVFSLCVIALDRCWQIVFPLKARTRDAKTMGIILLMAWLLAFLYGLRVSLVYEQIIFHVEEGNSTRIVKSCTVPEEKVELNKYLIILDCVVIFAIPFLIIVFCHVAIAWRLCKHNDALGEQSKSAMAQKHKIVKHLLALSGVFLICHAPLYIIRIYISMGGTKFEGYFTVYLLAYILSFLNAVFDVFLYATMSGEVRTKIMRIVACKTQNRVGPNISNTTGKQLVTHMKTSATMMNYSENKQSEVQQP